MDPVSFRYPKPLRFNIGEKIGQKRYLKPEDERYLLSGRVIVEEKMDGKETIAHSEKLRMVFCLEDLKTRHSIAYRVPARFALFGIYSTERGVFLSRGEWEEEARFLMRNRSLLPAEIQQGGIFPVKLLSVGKNEVAGLSHWISVSEYAFSPRTREPDYMEGIVVKPDRELFYEEHLAGKIVRTEFLENITAHYTRKKRISNEIDAGLLKGL